MKKYTILLFPLLFTTLVLGHQLIKTSLKFTVRDTLGNLVEGASVRLYATLEDYQKEINPVNEEAITNAKGEVIIRELESKAYFVWVEKEEMNNMGLANQTDTLQAYRLNKLTIIIE
ncbi:carboxypeptidase regulatory-like domain-containing protein [Cytophagales bacterium LB-30]|uniref:Carboxypeptidase regulatory-like domain-containing protein n=1 Tax=Shiella aurantiaca TaxID=3058365 RepID=A0ABT8F983_9BACT|nr:carboxypeptidase regulatory-like domain-containing protein [Shiella aurantiaca]MDN4166955.1 carboxypeptidase regulatory-like domain-containing protein [Shiella aurantiaca]